MASRSAVFAAFGARSAATASATPGDDLSLAAAAAESTAAEMRATGVTLVVTAARHREIPATTASRTVTRISAGRR